MSKPNIDKLRKQDANEKSSKPKKFFKFGAKAGENGAFQ